MTVVLRITQIICIIIVLIHVITTQIQMSNVLQQNTSFSYFQCMLLSGETMYIQPTMHVSVQRHSNGGTW